MNKHGIIQYSNQFEKKTNKKNVNSSLNRATKYNK